MNHLRNFFAGMLLVAPSFGRGYPEYRGFRQDAENLRSDWANTGHSMRVALKKEKTARRQRPTGHGK